MKRDQELLTAGVKIKSLEDQNRDAQRHIRVIKESLIAKEEQYNLLLADVEELKRHLEERNKLAEKKSYQQRFGASSAGANEVEELQQMVELRDKRIQEMQRKLIQLDNLLAERDTQLERARLRLESGAANSNNRNCGGGPTSGLGTNQTTGNDLLLIGHLDENLRDKEKQVAILRDQRDRAEHELKQERDSHERTIKEYKMKLQSTKFEVDRLQVSDTNSTITTYTMNPLVRGAQNLESLPISCL